jgi:hypothetical protein
VLGPLIQEQRAGTRICGSQIVTPPSAAGTELPVRREAKCSPRMRRGQALQPPPAGIASSSTRLVLQRNRVFQFRRCLAEFADFDVELPQPNLDALVGAIGEAGGLGV